MVILCPSCGRKYVFSTPEGGSKRLRCIGCGVIFTIAEALSAANDRSSKDREAPSAQQAAPVPVQPKRESVEAGARIEDPASKDVQSPARPQATPACRPDSASVQPQPQAAAAQSPQPALPQKAQPAKSMEAPASGQAASHSGLKTAHIIRQKQDLLEPQNVQRPALVRSVQPQKAVFPKLSKAAVPSAAEEVKPEAKKPLNAAVTASKAAAQKVRRIIVASDNELITKALGASLRDPRVILEFAADGHKTIELVGRHKPDLLILDAALQGVFSFAVCELIKSNDYLKSVKIILTSAVYNRKRYKRPPADLLGADEYKFYVR